MRLLACEPLPAPCSAFMLRSLQWPPHAASTAHGSVALAEGYHVWCWSSVALARRSHGWCWPILWVRVTRDWAREMQVHTQEHLCLRATNLGHILRVDKGRARHAKCVHNCLTTHACVWGGGLTSVTNFAWMRPLSVYSAVITTWPYSCVSRLNVGRNTCMGTHVHK